MTSREVADNLRRILSLISVLMSMQKILFNFLHTPSFNY